MNRDQKVTAEPAGNSEAGWSTRARSTLDLPGFETGEFDSLVKAAGLPGGPDESAEGLEVHMRALIGSEAEEQDAAGEEIEEISAEADEDDGPGLLRRTGGQVVNKLTRR